MRFLVLCTHNSARSQMAEGWLRHLAGEAGLAVDVWSAGTEKTRVKPEAIAAMAEVGIDLSGHTSKTIEEVPDLGSIHGVLTVCDSANESCPLFPAAVRRYHVSVQDPSGKDMQAWRQSREHLRVICQQLVEEWKASEGPRSA